MKITNEWLKKHSACQDGVEWFNGQEETDPVKLIKALMKDNHFDYANWLICQIFNKKQKVMYAIFAAKQVLNIFEDKYPGDKRPRKAIETAEKYLKNPCEKTKKAAYAAAYAAYAARKKLQIKIINYGIKILKEASNV